MIDTGALRPENEQSLRAYYQGGPNGEMVSPIAILDPNIVWTIPGHTPVSGAWIGTDQVRKMFDISNETFWMVHSKVIRTVTGPDDAITVNDSIFKYRKSQRFIRVSVLHHFKFGPDGRVLSIAGLHDTNPSMLAYHGRTAFVEPIPPPELLPGEAECEPEIVRDKVAELYARLESGGDPADLLAPNVTGLAPGNSRIIPFAGSWIGPDQVSDFLRRQRSILTRSSVSVVEVFVNGGTAAVVSEQRARTSSGSELTFLRYELIQFTVGEQIGRVTLYIDTDPLAQLA